MELIFNPSGEFRRSPEGPHIQIHSPHLLVGAPGSIKGSQDAKETVGWRKQRDANASIET